MPAYDWLVIWRDFCLAIAWFVAVVYALSGGQDLIYDVGAYIVRAYRRFFLYRTRERLSLERLRMREQQRIAVTIPAWNEGSVIQPMLERLVEGIEYRNYVVFVGTYPNDPATQQAVEAVSRKYPHVVKVVNTTPGPTSKADCLNTVYQAIKQYERTHDQTFDIIVMHDAEDTVHPYSFLVYNYLIPRVDAIQLPILPLPTFHSRIIHWIYADEFAENHMKDVIVREKMRGFVPFAGTGTGFSRRVYTVMEERFGRYLFNEQSLTEDYSLAKRLRDLGLTVIFVSVVLKEDLSPWFVPLSQRPLFIANWAYFPMDFTRSVRQKTRWILGISLQEWERSGWQGDVITKENLVKDRKVFVSSATNFLGYAIFLYFVVYEMGQRGWLPFYWLPIIERGTPLYAVVLFDTFLMFFRFFQRIVIVGSVYGLTAGLLAVPRMFFGNIVNGYAALRALQIFADARQGKAQVRWDKTDHQEGIGAIPSIDEASSTVGEDERMLLRQSSADLLAMLRGEDTWAIVDALELIPHDVNEADRSAFTLELNRLSRHEDNLVRAICARSIGYLKWLELRDTAVRLLHDRDWIVRGNAAIAVVKYPDYLHVLDSVVRGGDRFATEVLIRTIEQNPIKRDELMRALRNNELAHSRARILEFSPHLGVPDALV